MNVDEDEGESRDRLSADGTPRLPGGLRKVLNHGIFYKIEYDQGGFQLQSA